jgi:hypothetical protein
MQGRNAGNAMKQPAVAVFQFVSVAVALLQGVGEFATLQRWRLKEWITR